MCSRKSLYYLLKLLDVDSEQLQQIVEAYGEVRKAGVTPAEQGAGDSRFPQLPQLMVGFNRVFSPSAIQIKRLLGDRREPMVIGCRINAGYMDPKNPDFDPDIGGGRIIGEACHFVDLIQFFTGSTPVEVYSGTISGGSGSYLSADNMIATIKLADGSVGTIMYTAAGDKAYPKERVEIFCSGAVYVIDNFKSWQVRRQGHKGGGRGWNIDRGYRTELDTLFDCVRESKPFPVSLESYVLTTLTTFCIEESRRKGAPVSVDPSSVYGSSPNGVAGG